VSAHKCRNGRSDRSGCAGGSFLRTSVATAGRVALEGSFLRTSVAMAGRVALEGSFLRTSVAMAGRVALEGSFLRTSVAMAGRVALEGSFPRTGVTTAGRIGPGGVVSAHNGRDVHLNLTPPRRLRRKSSATASRGVRDRR
jgi:hypothetical protein